jgi:hypothetical protein
MKTHKYLLVVILLFASTLLLTSIAFSGFSIRLEKDVAQSELTGVPSNISFNIYDSETGTTIIASQTFPLGEWSADHNFTKFDTISKPIVRFRADFTETDALTRDMELWFEIELDGVVKGQRERVPNRAWAMFSDDTKWEESGADIYYSGGDVGIGTMSPVVNLDVRSTAGPTSLQLSAESATGDATIRLGTDGAVNYTMGVDDSDADKFKIGIGTNFGPDTTTRLTLTFSGDVGLGTTSPDEKLHVMGNVQADDYLYNSSRKYKDQIKTLSMDQAITTLKNLRPVTFKFKTDNDENHVGFIAEEVPDLVATKDRKGLSPMDIVAVLTKVVQTQQRKIEELESRLNAMQ